MRHALTLLLAILLPLLLPALANAGGNIEDLATTETIELLHRVEQSGCTFLRNGSKHDAREAADHLRSKIKRAGKRMTTEQFIQKIASKSSSTGEPYHIVTADGKHMTSEDWFLEQLADIRGGKAPPAPPTGTKKKAAKTSPKR